MATLGRSPWQRESAAIVGGALVAIVAALAIAAVARVDVAGFYPRAEAKVHWTYDGRNFLSDDGRWIVDGEGVPTPQGAPSISSSLGEIPNRGRAAAALATAALGLALPMLVARARSRRATIGSLAAIALGALTTVLAFQAAAAGVTTPLFAPIPPLLLLALAASRYRSGAWSKAKSPR
jgi:hypothetical protein